MEELKPCPFCWGEAVGFEWSDDSYSDDETEPHDPDAYCSVKVNHKKDCILEVGEFYSWIASTEAEAAELWNTRAERTCKNESKETEIIFSCSQCLADFINEPLDGAWNYCPNCGAKVVQE